VLGSTFVRITRLAAHDFLSYERLDLPLDPGLTVVTGPNGAGKTGLSRLLRLAKSGVAAAATGDWTPIARDYTQAGRYGAQAYTVRVGAALDDPADTALVEDLARAAVVTALTGAHAEQAAGFDQALPEDLRARDVLAEGELVVSFDTAMRHPWSVRWQTPHADVDLVRGRVTPRGAAPGPGTATLLDWLREQGDPLAALAVADGQRSTATLGDLLGAGPMELSARALGLDPEPRSIHRLHRALGVPLDTTRGTIGLAHVLDMLMRGVVVSNEPGGVDLIGVPLDQMTDPRAPLPADAPLGARLLRRKNGDVALRASFTQAQAMFTALTGADLDVVEQTIEVGPGQHELTAVPVVPTAAPSGDRVDIPLRLSGQGLVEAARLAVVLTEPAPVLFLDEPAANVSAVLQRRLLTRLLDRSAWAQTVVITHSAHLVPARGPDDLDRIVRLSRAPGGATDVHRASSSRATLDRHSRLLGAADIRDALFAAAVWLVEGATEQEALTVWLAGADAHGLPTPESAHVVVIPVDGDQNFAKHADLMRNLGIPYGVLADGPALREAGPLRTLPGAPNLVAVSNTFAGRAVAWAATGVRTLADDYHDDGSKKGEIEAFFARVNATEWARVSGAGKIRKGTAFAAAVRAPPEILALWRAFLGDVGLPSG